MTLEQNEALTDLAIKYISLEKQTREVTATTPSDEECRALVKCWIDWAQKYKENEHLL